jgi:hypothetical protein
MNDITLKRILQQITDDQSMKVLRYVADILIANWQKSSAIGPSEWETVKNTILREERKNGVNIFLQELERIAHE